MQWQEENSDLHAGDEFYGGESENERSYEEGRKSIERITEEDIHEMQESMQNSKNSLKPIVIFDDPDKILPQTRKLKL